MADPRDLFDLSGRVACVTGASGGLGQHAATVLAGAGAKVVGVARRRAALQSWQSRIGAGADFVVADVAGAEPAELARQITQPFGAPDILVHAAGINPRQPADDVTRESWDQSLSVNLAAPFFLSQALVPAMRDRGWGRIVAFSSLQSSRAFPGGIAYGAAKAGLVQLTRAMAEAWSGAGITANAIGPGFFHTRLSASVFADPARVQRNADQTCIGRNGVPGDLDGPLLFLCSQASAYVTGQLLMVDGGFTAK